MKDLMQVQHPGFGMVQAKIAKKEKIPMKNAGAILANASRKASKKAKKKNPNLKKVKMPSEKSEGEKANC